MVAPAVASFAAPERGILSDPVARALRLLTAPAGVSDARWSVVASEMGDRPAVEVDAVRWVDEELQIIEAAEQVKAWADSRALAAMARLRDAVEVVVQTQADRWSHGPDGPFDRISIPGVIGMVAAVRRSSAAIAADVAAEVDRATSDEVMLATGLPEGEVRRRLALAVDKDGRGALLRAALAAGGRLPDTAAVSSFDPTGSSVVAADADSSEPDVMPGFGGVTLGRAVTVHQQTAGLYAAQVLAISSRLVAPGPDGQVRSHRWFTQTLHRQVVVHTPDPVAAHTAAVADRRAYATLDERGTGTLTVSGDAARVTAAMDRVDTIARHLRAQRHGQGGETCDGRTLEQLRSDVALDLILYGHTPAPTPLLTRSSPAPAAATVSGPTSSGTTLGQAPPASVTVVVNLSTPLGVDEGCGEIPGYGPIPAVLARQAALAEGSVWRRLVTDPVSGTALDLSTHRYRPTKTMADLVAALDGVCRAPGCTIAASRCDLDHTRPWPAGPTTIDNLAAVHRRHHNHKTRGTWHAIPGEDPGDGVGDSSAPITWITMGRRQHVTTRFRYDDPWHRPADDDELDSAQSLAAPCVDRGLGETPGGWTDPPPF